MLRTLIGAILQQLFLAQLNLLLILRPLMLVDSSLNYLLLILNLLIIISLLLLGNFLYDIDLIYLSQSECALISSLL